MFLNHRVIKTINMYKFIISIVIFFISENFIFAQCPTTLTLCSQNSVDAFPTKYRGCRSIDTLYIDLKHCLGELNDIVNLDSLYSIEFIGDLTINLSPIFKGNFYGLSNVKKINNANVFTQKSWRSPLPFDTVNTLVFNFPKDTITDISLLSNLKFISKSITFLQSGNFTPPLDYRTNDSLNITIENNVSKNRIQNVLPKNLSASKISFHILSTQNIDFDFGYKVDSIKSIKLIHSPNNDFSTLREVKKFGLFEITNSNIEKFACEEIGFLAINVCSELINLGDLFPNLKKITNALGINFNKNLKSIDILDKCELPSVKPITGNSYNFGLIFSNLSISYILISNNPKLNTCNSDYLCRAFKRFGDSIYIGDNLNDCNDELLQKECSISSVAENDIDSAYTIIPNPVTDVLTISPPMPNGTRYRVINLLGNTVMSGEMFDRISLGELPSGHYIIMLDKPDKHHPPQAIKIVRI